VRDTDLDDRAARCPQLDEQLGREERTVRLDVDVLERLASEELAGAIDVGDLEAEEDPIGEAIRTGVQGPDERIRASDPVADDHIGVIGCRKPFGQPPEVLDAELAVAIGEGHELVAGRREPGPQRGAVAEVGRVVDGAHDARVGGGQLIGEGLGPIARAIVDGDDLERLGDAREAVEGFGDEPLDVGLLVVGRKEVRQARDSGRCGARHGAASRLRITRASMLGSNPPSGWVS
jgi:hypothetical protein